MKLIDEKVLEDSIKTLEGQITYHQDDANIRDSKIYLLKEIKFFSQDIPEVESWDEIIPDFDSIGWSKTILKLKQQYPKGVIIREPKHAIS